MEWCKNQWYIPPDAPEFTEDSDLSKEQNLAARLRFRAKHSKNPLEYIKCTTYLEGVIDTYSTVQRRQGFKKEICIPESTPSDSLRHTFWN